MLWIGMTMTLAAGIVALTLVMLARRRTAVADLGSVSQHWITENRADSR